MFIVWKAINIQSRFFSDEEDESLEGIIDEILNILESYDPDTLQFNEKVRSEVLANIRFRTFISYHELKRLKNIASSLRTLIDLSNVIKADIEFRDIKPRKIKIKRRSLLFGRARKFTLEHILNLFEKGELNSIVSIPVENIGGENIDLAKALFVRAGILLSRRPPTFKAPSIEDLWNMANSINDSLLREYLKSCVMENLNVDAAINRRRIYIEKREEILKKISEDSLIKRSYLIIFSDEPDMRMITERIKTFKDSPLLYSMAKSSYYMIRLLAPPRNRLVWLNNISIISEELKNVAENPEYSFFLLPLIFATLGILNFRDMTLDDFAKMEKMLTKAFDTYKKIRYHEKNYLTTCHIGAINFFTRAYPSFLKTILFGKEEDIKELKEIALKCLEAVIASNKHLRRRSQFYCMFAAIYLGLVAYAHYKEGAVIERIPDLIESLLDEPLYLLWNVNRFHYLFYLVGITYAITFSLLALPRDKARDGLLRQLIPAYEQLWFLSKRVPMIAIFVLVGVAHLKKSLPDEITELNTILREAKELIPEIILERIGGE